MKITIGKHAGYCWGVKRSYKKLLEAAADESNDKPIVTLGPLIHNPQTIERLEEDHQIGYTDDAESVGTDTRVAVRTHGVKPQVVQEMEARGVEVLDLTCPLVRVIQVRAEKFYKRGYHVVIVGSAKHPEIISITGYVPDGEWSVVESLADIEKVEPNGKPIGVVCQSTHMIEFVEQVVEALKQRFGGVVEVEFKNTICFVTTERQEETKWLAEVTDAIIVVGGKESSNTEKLKKTALECGATHVVKIEDASELDVSEFRGKAHLGLLAGASTPKWVIDEVVEKIRNEVGEAVEVEDLTESKERKTKEAALDREFE